MRGLVTIVLLMVLPALVEAQPVGLHIEGTNIVLTLNKNLPVTQQQEILSQFGMKGLSLDSLWEFGNLGKWSGEGWVINKTAKGVLTIYKPVHSLSGKIDKGDRYLPNEMRNLIEQQTRATFGVNNFRKPSVRALPNGKTRFFFEGFQKAGEVILSGTFNEWSTLATPMVRTDSGWVADLPLKAGKHCYKFIVDGHWLHDLANKQQEDDGHHGSNSIYFVYNHTFRLPGYENARDVLVTGSFNNWNERGLRMKKTKDGWELPSFLKDGTHTYKFIVDGTWIMDPANADARDDGKGNVNSVLTRGNAYTFHLSGFTNAREVFLAGNFNNWKPGELKMKKTAGGWELPYTLAAGNYQYKYIVDGEWMQDPANPVKGIDGSEQNSLMVVEPNKTFYLRNQFLEAREVKIAGNFNDWQPFWMERTTNGWRIDLYVPNGKCLYKFVVDDTWVLDPTNPQWEQNEFGNGNSVLWITNMQ